jgi:Skp family chaperone for outer membrane proteins
MNIGGTFVVPRRERGFDMVRSLALTAAAVLLGLLAGCGGGDSATEANSTQDYCEGLRNAQKEFRALESGDPSKVNLNDAFGRLQDLADQAPPAVADEWAALDNAISGMDKALEDAGLGFNDLTNPESLQELDPQKAQELARKAQQLGGRQFEKASRAIEKHARTECNIKLG